VTTWVIAVVGGAVGGLWVGIVAMEYRRLGRMHREVSQRIAEEEKTRK
jgi:hypothetical protein